MIMASRKILSWQLNNNCNFKCIYCFPPSDNDADCVGKVNIDSAIKTIRSTKVDWQIHLTGGEPFLYPGFVDLCKKLTKSYSIRVLTNFSIRKEVHRFMECIPPEKVDLVYISLHILEREKLKQVDSFIKDVLLLEQKGYRYRVMYIMYPPLFERFEKDYVFFKKKGIIIFPKVFKGEYSGKRYPYAYTSEETNMIKKYNARYLSSDSVFSRNLDCSAGKDMIRIWPNGDVSRCVNDRKNILGNINYEIILSKKNKPCRVNTCSCLGNVLTSKSLKNKIISTINKYVNRKYLKNGT